MIAWSMASSWAIPLAMAFLALVSRLYGLGDKPLWYDEVLTLKRASLPFMELVADSFHNKHYPLYFLLTKPFAGSEWSEATLRLPAVFFGAMAVFLASRIAAEMAGRWAAVVTGLLMALSPLEVQFGQEARPYSMATASILMSTLGLIWLIGTPSDIPQRSPTSGLGAWLLYAVGMGAALIALGATAPCFVAINVIIALLWMSGRLPQDWQMGRWLMVNLAILAFWLPSLAQLLIANSGAPTRGLDWVPPLSVGLASNVVASLYLLRVIDLMTFEQIASPVPFAGAAVMAFAILGAARVGRFPCGILLIALTLVMPVALALISIAKPLFVPRYLLWSTGPYFILAGVGVAAVTALALRTAGVIGICASTAIATLSYYGAETKPRWDEAAAYLAKHARDPDRMITSSGLARAVLKTYLERYADAPLGITDAPSREEIERAIEGGGQVWLVHGRAGQGGVLIEREALAASWPGLGPALDSVTFGRHITISRHARGRR